MSSRPGILALVGACVLVLAAGPLATSVAPPDDTFPLDAPAGAYRISGSCQYGDQVLRVAAGRRHHRHR